MRSLLPACLLMFLPPAMAGELECAGRCRLDDAASAVKWRPAACVRPPTPAVDVSRSGEYNAAVDAFNAWLPKMQAYAACVNGEAAGDVKKASQLVSEGVTRALDEAQAEMSRAKASLDRSRPIR
jgi:hypothetical protein